MASDLLSTIRAEIDARLDELRPSLAEYEGLLVAAGALVDNGGLSAKVKSPSTRRARRTTRATAIKRGSAAGAIERAASGAVPGPSKPKAEKEKPKPVRAERGAAREAILAALDHGSHTVAELVVVTAMSAANVNSNLSRLASAGMVVKTEREGKTAYALAKAG
jgi:DNA-binding transcriptional ArsR family regulator